MRKPTKTSMRKRNETNGVIKPIGEWLQLQENAGNILWWDRLNSGDSRILKRYFHKGKSQFVDHWGYKRGCREGTPDMYFIMPNGLMVWVECKSDRGAQMPDQIKFQGMVTGLNGHVYVLVRCLDEMVEYHATLKGHR